MALTLVTAPTEEPVSVADARAQSRIDENLEDALLEGYLLAAREYVETYTRRALITQIWDQSGDSLGNEIVLTKPPILSVASVKYLDSEGVEQTLSGTAYRVVKRDCGDTVIVPAYGAIWPSTYPVESAVTVRFSAGYGNAAAVPQQLKQAILLLTAHWHRNREATSSSAAQREIPLGVEPLIFPFRVFY